MDAAIASRRPALEPLPGLAGLAEDVRTWRVGRLDARIHDRIQRRGVSRIDQDATVRRLVARREALARRTRGRRPTGGRIVVMEDRTGWGWEDWLIATRRTSLVASRGDLVAVADQAD